MIDIFFILFTGGMAVYVIIRAARLDRTEPWYEIASGGQQNAASAEGTGSAQGVRHHDPRRRFVASRNRRA